MYLSLVLPVYNSADFLSELHLRLTEVLSGLPEVRDYELIFVDDKSIDGSWKILADLAQRDRKVKAFKLAQNYGQHAAIATGLLKAEGDAAIVMDADLEDSPEEIPRFLEAAKDETEIVLSIRTKNSSALTRRIGSFLVRKLFKMYSRLPKGYYYGSYSYLSRAAINSFLMQPDRYHYYLAVIDRLPYDIGYVRYNQACRNNGRSSYDFLKLVRLFAMLFPVRLLEKINNFLTACAVLGSVAIIFIALSVVNSTHPATLILYGTMVATVVCYALAILSGWFMELKTSRPILNQTQIEVALNDESFTVATLV